MAAPAPPPAQATTTASPATTPMPPGAGQVVQGQLSAPGATPGAMSAASKRIAKGMLATTPGKMSWLRALSIAISFVYALAGAGTLYANSSALTRASTNTSQVVLVQGIYADLLRADADATNAFLVSGLERPEQRADYEAALARVSSNIAAAATAQPADADALATLNVAVQGYASAVESARAALAYRDVDLESAPKPDLVTRLFARFIDDLARGRTSSRRAPRCAPPRCPCSTICGSLTSIVPRPSSPELARSCHSSSSGCSRSGCWARWPCGSQRSPIAISTSASPQPSLPCWFRSSRASPC